MPLPGNSVDEEVLGVAAASRFVGRSPRTLRYWTARGLLPELRGPGRRRYYRRSDLERLRPRVVVAASASGAEDVCPDETRTAGSVPGGGA